MDKQAQKEIVETSEQRQLKKIAQLKAKLQKEESLLNHSRRKERNGQLVVMGVLVEMLYKSSDQAEQNQWREKAKKHLQDRNLSRALAAFDRLDSQD